MAVDGSHKDRLEDSSGRKRHSFPFAKTHRILWPEMAVTTTGSRTALGKHDSFPLTAKHQATWPEMAITKIGSKTAPQLNDCFSLYCKAKTTTPPTHPPEATRIEVLLLFCFMHKHPHDCQDEYTMLMNRNMIYIYMVGCDILAYTHTTIHPCYI